MVRRLPIRWRLTAWYGALLAVTYLVIGAGLYLALRFTLYDSFDEQLTNQTALALSGVQIRGGALALDDATRAAIGDDEHFIQLYDADGTLVLDAGGANGRPASIGQAIDAARDGQTSTLTRSIN